LAPDFPQLPHRREDLTDEDAERLSIHAAFQQAKATVDAREQRSESWLARLTAVWNGRE